MAGFRAHRASMMVVKSSRSMMQSDMAARLIFSYLRVACSVPWKSDGLGDAADDFEA